MYPVLDFPTHQYPQSDPQSTPPPPRGLRRTYSPAMPASPSSSYREKPPLSLPMEQMGCESPEECESWLAIFRAFDTNNDGRIPAEDLIRAMDTHYAQFRLTHEEAVQFTAEVDSNQDNIIDFKEFSMLMCKIRKLHLKRTVLYMGNAVMPRNKQEETTNYLLEYSCFPPPIFIITISILEVFFYLYDALSSGYGLHPNAPAPTWSPLILNPHHREWVWTYFTYIFVHVGYAHLLANLLVQVVLGISLELVHKGLRIGGLYLGGALMGALLFWVFDPKVYLAGASGGVYALMTAHIADVLMNWSEMPFRWIRLGVFALMVGVDFGHAFYSRFFGEAATKVAVTSHIGGAIAGFLLGIVLLRNLSKHKWETYIWYVALVVYILLTLILICLILANPF
uniref:EF-hand domain-containing protein n=1 Tax=Panagrellus redivivus TaxID=6233 RepID=A0A7E4W885_PANRE